MKRFLSVLFALCVLLSLCACTAEPQATEPTEETCQHNWIDATCATPKTCSICGTKEGYGTGHSWEEGVCTVCNAVDLSFDPVVNGTWLYLTKERWEGLDFQPDGTCDIKTVLGAPMSAKTLEAVVNAAVANLQKQYKENWESYAANEYYVLKIRDYYYVANMTSTTAEYTSDGKNITIMQDCLPFRVELISKNVLKEVVDESKYINMPVEYISDLLRQYKTINEG